MDISDTQQAILDFIAERIDADGLPPSQTEIAKAFGFRGVRGAQYHLEALESAGAIARAPGRARAIRVLRRPPPPQSQLPLGDSVGHAVRAAEAPRRVAEDHAIWLPVLGDVAAGAPIGSGAVEHDESVPSFLLDAGLFDPRPDFLLRVRGDSMRDEGILDGDLIGVQRASTARSGQIVVARIEEEITVKLLRMQQGRPVLLPRNADYLPIVPRPGEDFAIEGLYCGLLRPNR